MASYDSVLKFTQKVLKNFNFHSSILTEDELESLDLDLGLRKKLRLTVPPGIMHCILSGTAESM